MYSRQGTELYLMLYSCSIQRPGRKESEEEMAEAATDLSEDDLVEMEAMRPPESDGTFQQVTNLLNSMDNESAEVDTAPAGPDPRKILAEG
ncbi:maestro heat-like repeat-containing protein family member 2A [Fukomys damarensis]|uniref:maestro heat-like repeat-containing protein family member 2A n=1 Tax=Fukomys damarensis TaxID=885580 RepID=UPI00053FBE5C|nr:maestro heat-like repeat-containing protein family member 2A [Fukomys damarensis]